ncbi:uncharacterized protein Z520_07179 [Fonsecaea multimorphosa CBS 102226]|uniref:SnoaL-like domain-containing protein n=1 Tax=Fonsecaea multimorphosa CBS 102226 TaxID=1442371 RepID=A0A0D2H5E3_9EURO|nr:uncharacterized protein Z520_07179 [Fonsecaea multimorphosa CBS 102226]KIX97065.1 hypothetical protein Z520_07179 [Fonsecaea multimorphosa CBS 102226]OAL22841.1 hypothetical protein AYO22_06749 [Fonsecaea multimorphosa]
MANHTEQERVVQRFLDIMRSRNLALLSEVFAPKAPWWVSGNPQYNPIAGIQPWEARTKEFNQLITTFDNFQVTLERLTIQDNTVVAEISPVGTSEGKPSYENHMGCIFEVENGKVIGVKEYVDLDTVAKYFEDLEKVKLGEKR